MIRAAILLVAVAGALAIPHQQLNDGSGFYEEKFLESLPRSPICWSKIMRCEMHSHCSGSCSKCFGFVPGRRMSGLCGKPVDQVTNYVATAAPEQLRIAQGRDPSSMSVSWITPVAADAVAEFSLDGTTPTGWTSVQGTTSNYTSFCGGDRSPQYKYTSGFIHKVIFTGLQPETTYYYRVGSASNDVSDVRSFRTLPAVGKLDKPLSVALIGDLGQTAYSAQTVVHVENDPEVAAVLHAGDMSYADCDHKRWDSWGLMMDNLASTKSYSVVAGNHEVETDAVQKETFAAYKHRFAMPEVKPTEDTTTPEELSWMCAPSDYTGHFDFGNSFYSFDFSGMHVLMMNSYTGTDPSSNQYKWLEADLASVDRNVTPWVIALMHGPWYNTNRAHHDEKMSIAMQANMESLFFKHRVNAVFSGHVHAYERSFEVYANQTYAPGGAPMYFVIGDGGNREGHATDYYQQPAWSAFRDGNQYGHAKFTMYNSSVAEFRWMRNIDPELVQADSVMLFNNPANWGKEALRTREKESRV